MTAATANPQCPTLNAWVVPRLRLRRRIVDLIEAFSVVWVLGSAGAGKTTAVTDAVASTGRPVAWLTLDAMEVAPGRLLLQLEHVLAQALPGLPPAASDALAARIPQVEAAAYLAEATGGREATLVLDEVERLADAEPVRVVLATFIRRLPPSVRVVLISRRDVPLQLGSVRQVGGVGYVTEADLSLTVPEAARVLDGLDRGSTDAGAVVQATGGWVAGVLFEAWRSPDHPHGAGGEVDALSGYLATEIMQQLTDQQQWFLTATSVLREVTPSRAEHLGQVDAGEMLAGLRALHLPVSHTPDGMTMRCHPRFREFLRRRLDETGGAAALELHAAHGRLLLEEGQPDDAVEAFLLGHDLAAARAAGASAMPDVLRRGDIAVVARWLEAFGSEAVAASEPLTRGALAVALEQERWIEGAVIADRLLGMLRDVPQDVALEPGLAGTIGTCLLHVGRFDDAAAVIDSARPGPARDTWRWALGMDLVDRPEHYRDRPPDRGEIVDGLLHRYDYMHGRFDRLLGSRPAPWAAARSSRVAALRAVGRYDDALALLAEWPDVERSPAMTRIHVEILVDLGQSEKAYAAMARGREVADRSGPYCATLHHLLGAMLALRVERDPVAARAALDRAEEDPTAHKRTRILEQILLWRGLAALIDDDAELAAIYLRQAVATMLHWDRQLYLPAAGVYLAEAEWRLGEEASADQAADHALHAASVQGSNHLLLQVLHEYPSVLSRRLDAELGADSRWHELGRALLSDRSPGRGATASTTCVHEFGPPLIVHDGATVDPRLTRSFELLAYLAAHGGRASKEAILTDLFGGGTDDRTRSYLRQAIKRLRDALPTEGLLSADGPDVAWADSRLTSESVDFEEAVRRTLRLQGWARLDADLRALGLIDRGAYFPGCTSEWIEARRVALQDTATDVRLDAADIAYSLGSLEQARRLAERVLDDDPYRESAWRLSMRIAAAMGHDDLVIRLYRRCGQRLAELETTPAASTQRLLGDLRR